MSIAGIQRLAAGGIATSLLVALSGCGGGGASGGDHALSQIDEADQLNVETVVVEAADTSQDIARLRTLGFEVFEAPDSFEGGLEEAVLPLQLFETEGSANPQTASVSIGRETMQSANRAQPLIVGGSFAVPGQYPFVVFVSTPNGNCTGSLIGSSWVKTADHCLSSGITPTAIAISLGSIVNGYGAETRQADYYARLGNDTALVRLSLPSSYMPVAYNGDSLFDISGTFTSLGFGRVSATGPVANLKAVENTVAAKDSTGGLTLGVDYGYATVCFGDSGGPTLKRGEDGYPIDVATTSATYSPACTGRSYHATTSYLAPQIQQVTGVVAGTKPTSNRPPVIAPVGTIVTPLGPTSVAISATDREGDEIAYTASGLPSGLSINAGTGVISGSTQQYTFQSPYTATVVATDKRTGASSSATFPWLVNTPGNADPAIQDIPNQTSKAGAQVSLSLASSDPNGDEVSLTATGLPPGIVCAADGRVSGAATRAGTYQVTVKAFDGKGGFSMKPFTWTISNQTPSVSLVDDSTPPSFGVRTAVRIAYVAADPDGDDVKVSAVGLPSGLVVDEAASVIKGTPTAAGSYVVSLVATDPYGGTASKVFTLLVVSTLNGPPTMTELTSRTDLPGVPLSIPIAYSDPDGHKTTIAFRNLPPGLVFDAASKMLRGSPTRGGTYGVDYYIYDQYGARTTYPRITWEIPNSVPVLSAPPNMEALPGAVVQIPIPASDPDGHPFTISAVGLPKGVILNNVTKSLTGTILQGGTFTVKLTATDKYQGKSEPRSFVMSVPNDPPVIVANLPNMVTVAGTQVNVPLEVYDPEGHRLLLSIGGLTVVATPSSLPPGLVLDATNKRIYGTPVRAGNFTVSLRVADVYGAAAYMPPFVWSITNERPSLALVDQQSMAVGSKANVQLSATDAEGHPLTYYASSLPPGLRIASATGLIYGTPTQAGLYQVKIWATDKYGGVSTPQLVPFVVRTG